uniref:SecY n=1 Tax=Schimmelmannia schousboei TaxID=173468 RepID=A0A0E3DB65_9FLOR|nr:SecY [Schimmelmannia schousboei]
MLIIRIHFTELIFIFFYFSFSLVLCILVSISNLHSLILFETYPFLQFSNKKFIITHITDIIDIVWFLVLSNSLLSVFPLLFFQLTKFFSSSWYIYQLRFSNKVFVYSYFAFILILIICYLQIIPITLSFLSQWEYLRKPNSILNIELEFRILSYILWTLAFRNYIGCFIFIIFIIINKVRFLYHMKSVYIFSKLYRKQVVFFNLFCLFLISPSDIFLQFLSLFLILVFFEIVFFFICYKVSNLIN